MNFGRGMVFGALGVEFVVLILASYYFGSILDEKFGWNGLGVVSLTLMCFAGWVTRFVFMVKKFMKDQQADEAAREAQNSHKSP